MKKLILYFVIFVVLFTAFSYGLYAWTEYSTNGQCDSFFICYCKDIGPGICDGAHEHLGRYK